MPPSISVIIPVKNGRVTLPKTLQSLQAQTCLILGEDYEIIVVDDGSDDGTDEIVPRLPGLRVISQANAGPAAARNTGAFSAQGDILVFTDADCIPCEDWLVEMTLPFRDETISGVKGVYRTSERGAVPRFVQLEFEERYRNLEKFKQIDFVDTYSAAYRASVFKKAGGFDTNYPVPSVEDQELSFRLARNGARLVFKPSAAVYHRHDLTITEYARRKFGIGYWKAYLLQRMPEKAFQDTYTPQTLRLQIALTGILIISLLLAIIWPFLWILSAACLSGFLFTVIPFFKHAVAHDPALALWIVPMLIIRAISLGSGLVAGGIANTFHLPHPHQG
jgi:cellulose synthase/poly-beta-1,6-N-acetylglucosamine synthase-like glycosyltransferase